jgi:hypothetical protein
MSNKPEMLLMSSQDRLRLGVLAQLQQEQVTQGEAARLCNLSVRQMRRLQQRYRLLGDKAIVHASRGRPSHNQAAEGLKDKVLAQFKAQYPDFGPTYASEQLQERDGLCVQAETLRLWLIEADLWKPRRKRAEHRSWRERKARFGELVQLDGSEHVWFEDRGPRCFLMNLVDDATGRTLSLMSAQETTVAAMQ